MSGIDLGLVLGSFKLPHRSLSTPHSRANCDEQVVREASSEPETHRLRVTLNWFQELRARVPN
jgi:hypothetical protein